MRGLALLLLLLAAPVHAADYVQPEGAPQVAVPGYGVIVSVFVVQTPVGHGIGVLEKREAGWYLCGQCVISPEMPNLESAVRNAGGAARYVESKREAINALLARRYPVKEGRKSDAAEEVNRTLAQSPLRIVNGVPQLGAF